MAVHVDTLTQPWLWWQYLTAGFAHSPRFRPHLRQHAGAVLPRPRGRRGYGAKEFLRLYLVMVVFGNVVWNATNKIIGTPADVEMYGASGAIAGVVVLYALNFPHRMILLFFVIPMPAWVFGVLVVGLDIFGASRGIGRNRMWRIQSTWPAPLSRWFTTSGMEPRGYLGPLPMAQVPPKAASAGSQTRGGAGFRYERGSGSHPGKNLPRRRGQPFGQGTQNPGNGQPGVSEEENDEDE